MTALSIPLQNVRRHCVLAILLVLALFSNGCKSVPAGKLPVQVSANAPGVLKPGDVIKVTFPGAPELTQSQRIRPDGKISLPLLGEVSAGGKRFGAFQDELAESYKPQIKNTEVMISLESSVIPSVVVDGAVHKPGSVPCEHPMTVFEAIMQAGGFIPESDLRRVKLFRLIKDEHRCEFLDLRPAMKGQPTRAVYVQGGDVIFVAEKAVNF